MSKRSEATFLGIECGATHTVALLARSDGSLMKRIAAGGANLKLMSDDELIQHFQGIAKLIGRPEALGIGIAGARSKRDLERIEKAANLAWPAVSCFATSDLETALAAASEPKYFVPAARVLLLSGTGSCCFGKSKSGRSAKVGGWGHILGDKGSGYEIGLRGLKAVVYYYDRDGVWPKLGARLLRKLSLNEPNDLIEWAQKASKADIAELAMEIFLAREGGDRIASDILEAAAETLAKDAADCAKRLVKADEKVQFVFGGSVLLKQPQFQRKIADLIRKGWRGALISPLKRESAWGAVELAKRNWQGSRIRGSERLELRQTSATFDFPSDIQQLAASPTEQRNPLSMNLDKLSIGAAIELMLKEDAKIPAAVLRERKKIEQVVRWIVQSFKSGGRLFYVGAGTSGRLGVLDASECPPTFRAEPEMVQGIIAGGQRAIWESVEGAEDDPQAGADAVSFRKVRKGDVLVGIAASGRTPFVWGAMQQAGRNGARTVLLCFNPKLKMPSAWKPDLVVAPNLGPEILTGSTRLKAGTATKLILNIFTTLAMVQIGKVLSNLMIDVKASNTKLRDRAARILQQLTNCDYETAVRALEKNGWQIKTACDSLSPPRRLPST